MTNWFQYFSNFLKMNILYIGHIEDETLVFNDKKKLPFISDDIMLHTLCT